MSNTITLKRSLSLLLVIFYGIGTILGAGIYALLGKIVADAKIFAPFSFLVAVIIALFTALSYAELSTRFPRCAGAALYVQQAWRKVWLSQLIGWGLVFTGIVSTATMANAFVGYLQVFIPLSPWIAKTTLIVTLGAIALWGINESVAMIVVVTLIEIFGLIFVMHVASQSPNIADVHWQNLLPGFDHTAWIGIMNGAFLAFYAFIGFEDMVNLAEETKNPERNLPIAILFSLFICVILYTFVAVIAVMKLPVETLATSNAPFATLLESGGGYSPKIISIISLFAIVNGSLVQIIMATRVLHGLSKEHGLFKIFSKINKLTRTPVETTVFVTFLMLFFALWLPLVTLAKLTTFVILLIFCMVNLALIVIKQKAKTKTKFLTLPKLFPYIGLFFCILLLLTPLM